MNKTIIAVYETAGKGKSASVKKVCELLLANFPKANLTHVFHPSPSQPFTYSGDICVIIDLNGIRIGIESQGDPNSRMLYENNIELENGEIKTDVSGTIEKLALYNCDVILCATRTEGATVWKVDNIANRYGYNTLWKSSNNSPSLNHIVLNRFLAEEIINIIKALIVGQL
jgi:hypothetical protein